MIEDLGSGIEDRLQDRGRKPIMLTLLTYLLYFTYFTLLTYFTYLLTLLYRPANGKLESLKKLRAWLSLLYYTGTED